MDLANVLIVDDDPRNLRLLGDVLRFHGFTVRTCDTGESACSEVSGGYRPAVVLMDIHMPGMGGVAAIGALKALPDMSRARFVAMTASVMPHQLASLQAAGIDGFHAKPVDIAALLAQIRDWTRADPGA